MQTELGRAAVPRPPRVYRAAVYERESWVQSWRYASEMKGLALAMLAACGSPQSEPQEPSPLLQAKALSTPSPRIDAAVPVVPFDADPAIALITSDVPVATDAGVSAPSKTVRDYIKASAAPEDCETEECFRAAARDTWADAGDLDGDGVMEVDVDFSAWCIPRGKNAGMCVPGKERPKKCPTCLKRTAWACFKYTERTAKTNNTLCWKDYGTCVRWNELADREPEASDISPCVIFRQKGSSRP